MIEQDFEALSDALSETEAGASGAVDMVAAFGAECERLQKTLRGSTSGVTREGRNIGKGLRAAFDAIVLEGKSGADALRDMIGTMSTAVLDSALKPVQNQIGTQISNSLQSGFANLFSGAFANGGAFSGGRVRAFASGGVVDGPTSFPMRGGMGLMGEAGPEAIMPLSRGADGKLGVRAGGTATPVQVHMTVNAQDAGSFRRSQAQVAAGLNRAIARGQRNL